MPPANNGSGPLRYDVSYPGLVLERLDRWADLARRYGLGQRLADAIREMRHRLSHDPRGWGDPLRDLRGMNATLYRRYGPVLLVTYGVHNASRVVFVQQVWLTPRSPLWDAEIDPPLI